MLSSATLSGEAGPAIAGQRVKFEADGQNVDADPVLVQYINGAFVTIFPAAAALAEPLWPMNA